MGCAPTIGARACAGRRLAIGLLAAGIAAAPWAAVAQAVSPFSGLALSMGTGVDVPRAPLLTIERDVLYRESAYGQRLQADLLAATRALAEENRRIEADLTERELELTRQREGLTLEEFRGLADGFDARVSRIRNEQDSKARDLQRRRELERQTFFAAALPILAEIVREAGAVAVLDRGSVFLTAEEIDVTEVAIRRMDRALGDGSQFAPAPPDSADRPVPRPAPTPDTPDGDLDPAGQDIVPDGTE